MKRLYFFTLILISLNYSVDAQLLIVDKESITKNISSELKIWSVTELANGGRIDAIRVLKDSVVVCGARGENRGKLYISYDYGNTWNFLAKPTESEITCIAESDDLNTFFILTGEAEVYVTKDQGRTWKKLTKLTANKNKDGATASYSLICTSKGTLLVSDTDSDGGHIFRSVNMGKTWKDLGAIGKDALYRFEKAGDGILVNGFEGSIYKSPDDGLSWNKVSELSKSALFASEYLGGTMFLQADQAGNIYRSENMGESWQKADSLNGSADDFIYLKDGIVMYSTYTGSRDIYVSLNYGKNWLSLGNVPTSATGDWLDHGISMETADSVIVLAGTGKGYIIRNAISKVWLSDMTAALDPKELKKSTESTDAAMEVSFRNPRVPSIGSKNLLPNSSFELGKDGWSSIGKSTGWGGDLWSLFGEIDTVVFKEGKRSLRIDLGPGKTEITYSDVWPMDKKAQTSPLAANRGWIDVVPGQTYTFSAYMRADRNGIPALLTVYQSPDPAIQLSIDRQDKILNLSSSWLRYSFTITATQKQIFVAAGPNLANENDSATVWIDAVQFEKALNATAFSLWSPVEIGISTGKFGNILDANEPAVFKITGLNSTLNEVIIPVECSVIDYFDENVLQTEKQIAIGAENELDMDWSLLLPGKGYYNVTFSWKYNNKDYSRSFPMAFIDPYLWEDSHFGVNHSPTTASASYAIQMAGMKWDRDWSLNWGMLEPQEGNLSFLEADKQILSSEQRGFNTLTLLPPLPSPNWGSTAPASVPANLWYRMAYMPSDVNKLMNFISTSIEHYKTKLKYWEFLNEPVWTSFCLPGTYYKLPDADYVPADYIKLLKKAYATMKQADPSCIVIGGFSAEPWRYTKEFMQADGLNNIDILNIHNYGGFSPPEAFITEMDTLISQMDRYGGRKPIWITEYSYYGADSLPWTPWKVPKDNWGANLLLKDERQCSDWTIRYNTIMFARGVEKVFYHEPIDGLINDGALSLEFAFMGEEGVPRKLYAAQSAQAMLLGPQFTFAGQLENNIPPENSTTHQIQGYSFQSDQRAVLVAWISEKETSTVKLVVPQGVEIFNIAGTKLIPSTDIILSNSPVYIVSDSMTAVELLQSCEIKKYEMDVLLLDDKQNLPLPGITVSVNEIFAVSDSNGIAHFSNVPYSFVLNIQDPHYTPVEKNCSISSDTTITIPLVWKGNVTFTLQDQKTQEKFWGVVITFGTETLVSDINGQAVFSVESGTYDYSINKISYKPEAGTLTITSDSSFVFNLEQLSAYTKFRLKDGITPVNDAIVKMGNDSLLSNALGIAMFKALPVDNLYSYSIRASGYFSQTGEFFLSNDTLIDLVLVKDPQAAIQLIDKNKIRVWPNPVSDFLYCSFPRASSDNTILITDLVGNMIFSEIVNEFELHINMRNIPSGAYIVMIQSENDDFRKLFFKN